MKGSRKHYHTLFILSVIYPKSIWGGGDRPCLYFDLLIGRKLSLSYFELILGICHDSVKQGNLFYLKQCYYYENKGTFN